MGRQQPKSQRIKSVPNKHISLTDANLYSCHPICAPCIVFVAAASGSSIEVCGSCSLPLKRQCGELKHQIRKLAARCLAACDSAASPFGSSDVEKQRRRHLTFHFALCVDTGSMPNACIRMYVHIFNYSTCVFVCQPLGVPFNAYMRFEARRLTLPSLGNLCFDGKYESGTWRTHDVNQNLV